jgi:hypothetical protein
LLSLFSPKGYIFIFHSFQHYLSTSDT